jgi:hypothetical protein
MHHRASPGSPTRATILGLLLVAAAWLGGPSAPGAAAAAAAPARAPAPPATPGSAGERPPAAGRNPIAVELWPRRGALLPDGDRLLLHAEASVRALGAPVTLRSITVVCRDAGGRVDRIRIVQGPWLGPSVVVVAPGPGREPAGTTLVPAGGGAVIWLPELAFPADRVPSRLDVVVAGTADGRPVAGEARLDLAPFAHGRPLRFPLRGEWMALNGPAPDSLHRRAALATPGELLTGQRYALDLVGVVRGDPGGEVRVQTGTGAQNSDFVGFGAPVLAPAAGVVTVAADGLEDHPPTAAPPEGEPAGNQLVIDHGNGTYSVLAHLKKGSLSVRAGERVRAGQEVANVGNSGHSTCPHLHYQLCDRPSVLESQGLPALFRDVRVRRLGRRWLTPVAPLEGDLIEAR